MAVNEFKDQNYYAPYFKKEFEMHDFKERSKNARE